MNLSGAKMQIDVLCNDGSPLGTHFSDIYGESQERVGLGGAELALHTLCEGWTKLGHRVRLYNNPKNGKSPYLQLPIASFLPQEDRDILIIFRSPNPKSYEAKGKKIWWSCDQHTVGSFSAFASTVEKIVTISQFHSDYFKDVYGILNTTIIDLPVRVQDYEDFDPQQKIPNRLIFCSVPDRGLAILANTFPSIREQIPDATLTITSDYRLWGVSNPRNEAYVRKFLGMEGVRFLGAVPRKEMVKEQMQASVHAYPCIYNELFCYSVAECQIAGAYPVTPPTGALRTTNMGCLVGGNPGDPRWGSTFIDAVVSTLRDPDLREKQMEVQIKAHQRFSIEAALGEWEKVFNE